MTLIAIEPGVTGTPRDALGGASPERKPCMICREPRPVVYSPYPVGPLYAICPRSEAAECVTRALDAFRAERETALAQARQEATTDPAAGTEDTGSQEDASANPVPAVGPDTAPGGVVPPASPGAVPAAAEVA